MEVKRSALLWGLDIYLPAAMSASIPIELELDLEYPPGSVPNQPIPISNCAGPKTKKEANPPDLKVSNPP
jgi:hypothetical protein